MTVLDDLVAGDTLGKLIAKESNKGAALGVTIAGSGTISHNGEPFVRVTTGGNVTGIIVQKGIYHGQVLFLANTSANTLVFAAVATSNVLDGANITLQATRMMTLVWSEIDGYWIGTETTT